MHVGRREDSDSDRDRDMLCGGHVFTRVSLIIGTRHGDCIVPYFQPLRAIKRAISAARCVAIATRFASSSSSFLTPPSLSAALIRPPPAPQSPNPPPLRARVRMTPAASSNRAPHRPPAAAAPGASSRALFAADADADGCRDARQTRGCASDERGGCAARGATRRDAHLPPLTAAVVLVGLGLDRDRALHRTRRLRHTQAHESERAARQTRARHHRGAAAAGRRTFAAGIAASLAPEEPFVGLVVAGAGGPVPVAGCGAAQLPESLPEGDPVGFAGAEGDSATAAEAAALARLAGGAAASLLEDAPLDAAAAAGTARFAAAAAAAAGGGTLGAAAPVVEAAGVAAKGAGALAGGARTPRQVDHVMGSARHAAAAGRAGARTGPCHHCHSAAVRAARFSDSRSCTRPRTHTSHSLPARHQQKTRHTHP
jgi:hypothetical protein